jgi:hypothetical protein
MSAGWPIFADTTPTEAAPPFALFEEPALNAVKGVGIRADDSKRCLHPRHDPVISWGLSDAQESRLPRPRRVRRLSALSVLGAIRAVAGGN